MTNRLELADALEELSLDRPPLVALVQMHARHALCDHNMDAIIAALRGESE